MIRHPPRSPLFPYPTLFRSEIVAAGEALREGDTLLLVEHGPRRVHHLEHGAGADRRGGRRVRIQDGRGHAVRARVRSEEHTSELQSQSNLVCRLLLEKKKTT